MARDYELGLIIKPDVGDDQARTIVDRVAQTVAVRNGQVVRVNAWGRRRLAYPIEHYRDGLFFFFDLIMPPESVGEIERTLHVNEAVMRHLVKVRDPRVAAQQRQRDTEAEAQAAAQAEQAAAAAQAAAQAAETPAAQRAAREQPAEAPAAAPAVTAEASEESTPDESTPEVADETQPVPAEADEDTDEDVAATQAAEANA